MLEYLLHLDFDGEILAYAYAAPRRVDGITFGPGLLDLSLPAREASLTGLGGGGSGISFSLHLDPIWALAQKGVRLQQTKVRLYAWQQGQTLAESIELFRGELRSPSFDFNAGVFSASASAPALTSDVPFPPAMVKDEDRFPDAPEESLRWAVPVIYGTAKGCPLIPLETAAPGAKFLVAGHKVVEQSIDVAIEGVTGGSYTVQNDGIDGLGQPYSYIEVALADYDPDLYAESVQGKVAPDGTAIDRLGDVLLDMWLSFARGAFYDLDRERVYSARSVLNRYQVGFFLNSRVEGQTLLDLLATRFGNQYPVVFGPVNGKFGWDAVFVPPLTSEPVANMIYGQTIHERSDVVETSVDSLVNRIQLEHGYDGFQGEALESLLLDDTNDGVLRGSISRWGKTPIQQINAGDVPAGTGYMLAEDLARRQALVRKQVTYSLGDPGLLVLPLFSVVTVTDALLGWSGEKFLIEGLVPRLDGRVDIRLISLRGT